MFFLIPFGTDAPINRWPKGTVGLILVNMFVFFATWSLADDERMAYALARGDGLHPLQWLTSFFMHADITHLVGNMIFLWAFGLVIEGKLATFWFLIVYLGIGLSQAAVMQVISLGAEGGHILGASAAIYGLMGLAVIWAPTNTITCFYFFWIFFRIFTGTYDVAILMFALFYIGWELLLVVWTHAAMSTPLLHLSGALIGLGLGVVMLKARLVDCENWDLFAVMVGREGKYAKKKRARKPRPRPQAEAVREVTVEPASATRRRERPSEGFEDSLAVDPARAATERFRRMLASGRSAVEVHAVYDRTMRTVAGWTPESRDWFQLIKALLDERQSRLAVVVMEDYLRRATDPSPRVRLKLAQVLLREFARPAHALRVLQGFEGQTLPADLEATRVELTREAEKQCEEGVLELGGEAW